jgi:membrane-bound lytic murein transglycosylase B
MPANLPVAFAAILAGGLLAQKGIESVQGGFSTASQGTPSGQAANTATGAVPTGSQKQQVQQVAAQYGLSPQTLWGVYGTESSFGADLSTSTAGAEGPFQFLPSTWATYGGGGNIMNFSDALVGAANLLKSLGANSDPNSAATAAALNHYSGGGGSGYISKVLGFGAQF